MLSDLRYALRTLHRSPAFAVLALVTLTLGIGANSALFSVVNAVLIRPLPYADPDQLVRVYEFNRQAGIGQIPATALDFLDWRKEARSFSALGAHTGTGFTFTGAGDAELVIGQVMSAEVFDALGVRPLLGRTLQPSDNTKGRDQVLVLSYALWQRRFGGDRGIVGRTVRVNDKPYVIVGVMPRTFEYPDKRYELWAPFPFEGGGDQLVNRNAHYLRVVGRLRPDADVARAQAEMAAIAARLEQSYPETNRNVGARVLPLREEVVGVVRRPLLVLLAAVALVLLIACANVTSLLLARATAREKELAVRTALGAARTRLLRQFLAESVLLYGAAALAGLLVAAWGVDLLIALSPGDIPRLESTRLDGRVFAVTLIVSLVTGAIFGLVPAAQAWRANVVELLKSGGRTATASKRRQRARSALVVAEVALAFVLLTGASLALRSFARLATVDLGFVPEQVLTYNVVMPEARLPAADQMIGLLRSLEEATANTAGVTAAGFTTHLPLSGQHRENGFTVEGYTPPPGQIVLAGMRGISARYFDALRIPITRGRGFTAADRKASAPVAIVNETFARRYWAGADPLGGRIKIGGADSDDPWRVVVGVVADFKHLSPGEGPRFEVSFPYEQLGDDYLTMWGRGVTFAVKTKLEVDQAASAVRAVARRVDPNLPLRRLMPMRELVAETVAGPRFRTLLLAIFACVALTLALVGVYGVTAYFVSQRAHEIGIRVALGATRRDVLRLVVGRSARLAAGGLAIGLAGAAVLTSTLETLLFEVRATDPGSYAAAAAILGVAAVMASAFPAWRAARLDPTIALRAE